MDETAVPFDLIRMFVGEEPPLFYAEILVRVLIVYIYTFALLRWIGGRTVAQLSMVEFLLVIALGSAVGDSLFYPDVPILHALAVVTVIVLLNKGVDLMIAKSAAVKRVVDGCPTEVLRDGRIMPEAMEARGLSIEEIYSQLRVQGVENLGQVRVAYLEPDGRMSLFLRQQAEPGLAIVPPPEIDGTARPQLARIAKA